MQSITKSPVKAYVLAYSYDAPQFRVVMQGRIQGGSMELDPPFERASLTRDTLIEQSNRYTLIKQSQCSKLCI